MLLRIILFLATESVSEDNSLNRQFVNDYDAYSNCISYFDAEVNFALILSFTRTPTVSRNDEDVITIRKKKQASENERLMALFSAIK